MLNLWQPAGLKEAPAAMTLFGATSLDFKRAGDGKVEGYGAIFGSVDQGWDMVEPGAFADSLKSGRKVKMLWQHNPTEVIGIWEAITEDDTGLRVKGRLLGDVQRGAEAMALLKAGAIDGLSIGYVAEEWREAKLEDGRWVRIIEKAAILEVSLVTFPMHTEAVVDVKAAAEMTRTNFERDLQRGRALSRKVTVALMCDGFKGIQALSKSGGDDQSGPDGTALSKSGGIEVSDELAGALMARVAVKQKIKEGSI